MAVLEIAQGYINGMIAHSRQEDPNECCGVLLGEGGQVVAIRRVTNSEASPFRYNMDTQEFFKVYKESEEKGWDMWGFYHSHTSSRAYPSQTDRNLAAWPGSYYLIVSLEDKEAPVVRAYSIADDTVEEHEIRAVDGLRAPQEAGAP